MRSIFFLFVLVCLGRVVAQAQSTDPKVRAKVDEARKAYNEGNFTACNSRYAEALKLGAGSGMTHYDYACCLAHTGDTAAAFEQLNLAVSKDFRDSAHMANDRDLTVLRKSPRFGQVLKTIGRNRAAYYQSLQYPAYAKRLTVLQELDQAIRQKGEYTQEDYQKMWIQDSLNLLEVTDILERVGRWPGFKEVGTDGSTTVWLLIQHAPIETQKKYVGWLEKAVAEKNASPVNLAYLQDRILMRQDKPQIYGTQAKTNPKTGKTEIFPIADPAHVDERRAKLGLSPLSEYKKRLGIVD